MTFQKLATMKQLVLFILLSVNLNIFSQNNIAENYKTAKFDAAIFPYTYIDLIPGDRFTPTRNEIDEAETNLKHQIKNLNSELINQVSSPIIDKNLKKYKRQYFGCTNEKGERILLINCFWYKKKDHIKNWLNRRISVLDGGSYYWEIKYNIKEQTFFDLYINGNG